MERNLLHPKGLYFNSWNSYLIRVIIIYDYTRSANAGGPMD